MASKPYFDKSKGHWYIKWKSLVGWERARLCPHPGWVKGDPPPKRPPADAIRLARAWEDKEIAVRNGIEEGPVKPVPLAGFLEGYLLVSAAGQTPGSMRLLRRVVACFVAWCRDQKVTEVRQVTVDVCRRYLAARAEAIEFATLKTERAVLSPAWSQAFQDGRVAENPWRRAPVPGRSRQEHPPFWTEPEVQRLAAACRPWLADIVIVGAYTGIRITALLGTTWDDVDFVKGTVHVKAVRSKSGKPYDAPMLGPARDVLERRRFLCGTNPLVFPGPKLGRRIHPVQTFKKISIAVKRSGVPDHGHFNHILRHSFATMCIMKGVPLLVVSRWLGHSNITMTQRYAHSDPKEMTRWANFLDSGRYDSGG